MIFIVDIDGTISDCEWRRHFAINKHWDAFFNAGEDDLPIEPMATLLHDLEIAGGNQFIYATGRPERVRDMTREWLDKYGFPDGVMYMRQDGDHRPDVIIKKEILDAITDRGIVPDIAFDDRNEVVQMWRDNGVMCLQVAEGAF
jgi:hypothetical protein